MTYIIEGGLNFYKELEKSLLDDNNIINNDSDENTCLITKEPLDNNHIELKCKHKFNFLPLYLEVKKQKKNVNHSESTRLSINQIKCPYCRNIQHKLLPFYGSHEISMASNIIEPIYGVNSPAKFCMYINKCPAIFKSGKRKGEMCNKLCNDKACPIHIKSFNNVKITCCATNKNGIKCKQGGKNTITIRNADNTEDVQKSLCGIHYKKYLKCQNEWSNEQLQQFLF